MTETALVFPAAPAERIELDRGVALVRCRADRAPAAVTAINASLGHLRPWMAWASEPATEAGLATFFAAAEELWDQRRDFGYSVLDAHEAVLGGCGLHGRQGLEALDIGYWVHVDHIGKGLATATARALTGAAFAVEGIERVRIQCDERNERSARVPKKLGYQLEGTSVPDDRHPGRLATQDWVIGRAAWMTRGSEVGS